MDSMNITDEAIAVIGMSCRFPGAPDLDGYWRNLCEGKVSVTFLDRKDLAAAGVDHGLLRDPNYVPAAYSLGDIDKFDAAFFGYAGSEAEKIDPQQRTFLECAWESLEDAGYTPLPGGGLEGKSVGVFAGSRISAYLEHACRGLKAGNGAEAFQCLVGNDKDYLCSRVSYKLNLNGPSLCVQTACSSSLSAVHVACENLRSGACDMALAGGVAIDVPQEKGYLFQEGMIFSRDGYCRPFDKNASGTVFSGGAGVVVLKRLADALRDRDHIYAVVLASVVNNDGSRRVGYTAPGEFGQTAVIGEAISLSGLSARDIGLVESHGTGTALGDPIEFAAPGKAFAIGSAALTALALMASYIEKVKEVGVAEVTFNDFSLMNPLVLTGLFIGACLPFVFAALTMNSVGRAAQSVVLEVRRQFREITGLMEGKADPDYARCVDLCTKASLKEMVLPTVIAVVTPIVVGMILGFKGVVGLLAGATVTGFLMAIYMANAGGAWDNAKKYIEAGNFGGKGSECHKAGVVGDTVGDPFKDTAGPAINILIKLLSMVSIVFAGLIVNFSLL